MRPFARVAARDLVIAALTIAAIVLDARLAPEGGVLAIAVAVVTGVLVSITSFLVHEWGHLLGAVTSGAVVGPPPRSFSPFLFHFDTAKSTRAQFLWMSAGGYAASVASVIAIVAWADLGRTSGIVALVLTAIGVLVTFVLEIPTTVRVARGAPLPTGGVYEMEERPRP